MGIDLRGRVPVAGMADCRLEKQEVPLRIRIKRREEEEYRDWTSLGSLWEEGERERARGLEREKVGETDRVKAEEMEREAREEVDVEEGVREHAFAS